METIRKSLITKANDVTKEGIVTVAVNGIGIEDADHDISMPGSFVETLKDMSRKRWLHNHDYTQLLGVPISGEETKEDLIMTGRINLKKQLGRDVLADYELFAEEGRTLEHSIGVFAEKRNPSNKKEVLKWHMMEYSTLSAWGANPRTYLVDIKSDAQQIRERAEFISKALRKSGYSEERLAKFDMELNLLLKSLDGATIVKCPVCGCEFDYDTRDEITADQQIRDMAHDYARSIASGIVWDALWDLEPQIRADVLSVLDSFKGTKAELTEKAIDELLTYVRCPECWARVYKSDTILKEKVEKSEEPEEEEEEEKPKEEKKKKSFWAGFDTIIK